MSSLQTITHTFFGVGRNEGKHIRSVCAHRTLLCSTARFRTPRAQVHPSPFGRQEKKGGGLYLTLRYNQGKSLNSACVYKFYCSSCVPPCKQKMLSSSLKRPTRGEMGELLETDRVCVLMSCIFLVFQRERREKEKNKNKFGIEPLNRNFESFFITETHATKKEPKNSWQTLSDADDASTSLYTISVFGRVEIENLSLITSQIGMFRREIPFSRREIKQQQQNLRKCF